jgi:hypothetical protein
MELIESELTPRNVLTGGKIFFQFLEGFSLLLSFPLKIPLGALRLDYSQIC